MVSFPMAKLILVAALSCLTFARKCENSCPPGWKSFNERCFKYITRSCDWAKAERYCVGQGGNLASVHSQVEYTFLQKLTKTTRPFWIGLTDCQREGFWFWSDGSKMDFRHWNTREPNNLKRNEDCVHANWSVQKKWNDIPCSNRYRFVCAKRQGENWR
ncbi:lactose-binding lectin l-2-like [Conger conger]|uniref:lactose-binding lectin l-2-like n=1 Tax=Conger conger TaxID=82655 RepID=UPI002A5AFAD8|nr:lactose-binding lectin l-2-like [Conger conger]XP_061112212.1 lactose-binding lectin l-2-like [Conger conger]